MENTPFEDQGVVDIGASGKWEYHDIVLPWRSSVSRRANKGFDIGKTTRFSKAYWSYAGFGLHEL